LGFVEKDRALRVGHDAPSSQLAERAPSIRALEGRLFPAALQHLESLIDWVQPADPKITTKHPVDP
jgi:hypothetical protein